MNEGRVSVRYAKALLATVKENDVAARALYDGAGVLSDVLLQIGSEYRKMLQSTVISEAEKRGFVERMVNSVAPELLPFAVLMYRHQRSEYLDRALRMFRNLYAVRFGLVRAHVVSSAELSESARNRILSFLQKRLGAGVELEFSEDQNLIGGFTVEVNDALLDCSVQGELRSMLSEL
ncbi:MAG: ATP synthase F1 subunit delta [Bacteroides sp.]